MTEAQHLSREEIEAAVARAREQRAATIRAGAKSLNLILKHFLSDRGWQTPPRHPAHVPVAAPAKA